MQELMKMTIWHCWNRKKTSDGKYTKVPIAASGVPTGTDEAHRNTLVAYEEAKQAVLERHYSGVGFVLPAGYFMLDIDHKDLDDPLVQRMLERFHITYAEISVSGHGIHILGKCDLSRLPTYIDKDGKLKLKKEFYQKNTKAGIELYIGGITNRYSTYSGKVINDVPLTVCTEEILLTLDQDMRRPDFKNEQQQQQVSTEARPETTPVEEEPAPKRSQGELEAEAFDIVVRLGRQRNGKKFKKLFFDGDFSAYKSQSEAELALSSMIAFRAGNDPELVDYIFRKSALYRNYKWERESYREGTISKAIDGLESTQQSRSSVPSFIYFNENGKPGLEPSLLAEYIRREVDYLLVRDDAIQMTLIYVYQNGCYHRVNKDSFLTVIKKPVMEFDPCLVRMPKINETYNQLMTDPVTLTQEDLNADEDVINFKNGLLYLTPEGVVLRPHSPTVYSTIQIPCNWNCDPTPTPVFDRYLEQLTGGDKELIQLLLEIGGVVISNVKGWHLKKGLFLVGPGDTGKTVFKTLLEKMLGKENCVSIDLKTIDARFGTSMLYGKRLAGSSELGFAKVNEMNTFKSLTGGDTLFMEQKREQGFTGRFDGFLVFCMNRLPYFGGDNGRWVYERIIPVVCKNVIPKNQQDKKLIDKLLAEREGICHQLVMELITVKANGLRFSEPESVIDEREKYMSENNSVIGFFTECMFRREDGKLSRHSTVSTIYSAYKDYCHENNNGYAKTLKEFKAEIAEYLGISTEVMLGRSERGTCFRQYDLVKEVKKEHDFLVA